MTIKEATIIYFYGLLISSLLVLEVSIGEIEVLQRADEEKTMKRRRCSRLLGLITPRLSIEIQIWNP